MQHKLFLLLLISIGSVSAGDWDSDDDEYKTREGRAGQALREFKSIYYSVKRRGMTSDEAVVLLKCYSIVEREANFHGGHRQLRGVREYLEDVRDGLVAWRQLQRIAELERNNVRAELAW